MRLFLAVFAALLLGLAVLPLVFSDVGPEESVPLRFAITFAVFLVAGFVVGFIARNRWPIAGLAAWVPILMGSLMLSVKLTKGTTPPFWSAIAGFLIVAPVTSLLGGFLGNKLAKRRSP